MAYRAQIYITPNTLTELTVFVNTDLGGGRKQVLDISDFTDDGTYLTAAIAYSSTATVKSYAQGYASPRTIYVNNAESSYYIDFNTLPLKEISNIRNNNLYYYCKDSYSRSYTEAALTYLDNAKADTTLSNVTSIDSNSAVQTALDGKANTSLSNLNSTGQAVIDGQWVAIPYSGTSDAIVYSATAPTSDLTKSLASKLPNDNYSYEVIFTGAVTTGNTSGNQTRIILSSSGISGGANIYLCSAQTRSSSAVTAYGTGIMPVGTDRNITIGGYANNTGAISLYAVAYRRIGTNS